MTTSQCSVKGRPATPEEIVIVQTEIIPPLVFDAFNEMIARGWNGRSSRVVKDDVVSLIRSKMGDAAIESSWLNVEPAYRKAGWRVTYDAPGFNESYKATYEFFK